MPTLGPHALTDAEARDHLELQRLAWLYCHAVDRGDMALLRTLYTDDGYDDHGGMFSGTADEYCAWLPRMLAAVGTIRHTIESMLFVIDGERAQGQLVNTAYHLLGDKVVVVGGRYLDTYARTPSGWRIRHRSLVMDWHDERPVTTGDGFIGQGVAAGAKDRSDPVYERLDLFREAF